MRRMLRFARAFGMVAPLALVVPPLHAAAQQTSTQQGEPRFSTANIASQLGVKLSSQYDDALPIGASITGTLEQPDKLVSVGIRGMHGGARVTVMRIGPDRIRVEADEVEPAEIRGAATLRLDGSGTLVPVTKSSAGQ